MLLQLPVFYVMYRGFSSAKVGGAANELLGHRLLAAPLGDRWADALGQGGVFGAPGLVFLGLFAAIAAVAAWSAVRGRRAALAPGGLAAWRGWGRMVVPVAAPLCGRLPAPGRRPVPGAGAPGARARVWARARAC